MLGRLQSPETDLLRRLPPRVRATVQRFSDAATAAHGAVTAAQERELEANDRLAAARRERSRQIEIWAGHGRKLDPETAASLDASVAEAEAERSRLRSVREDATSRYQAAKAVETRALDFLRSIPSGAIVREASVPRLPKGATLAGIRGQIMETIAEAERVERSSRPRAEAVKAIAAAVDAIAAKGKPEIDPRIRTGDPAKLAEKFTIARLGDNIVGDGGAPFFVWLLRDEIAARLAEMVPEDGAATLTSQQRERRLADLAAQRLELERIEELLVEEAEAEGRTITRRPDADVRAILGIEIIWGRS